MIYIREFNTDDVAEIYQLFYDTVHAVNKQDYTDEQLDIWAPKYPDLERWKKTLTDNHTVVAVDVDKEHIVGFLDMDKNGYLNHIYVHHKHQNQGIFKSMLQEIEKHARAIGLKKLFSDVSITAKSTMEKMGYVVEDQKTRDKGGVVFIQYAMTKVL